jgi:predicted nucleic acid-binding protein
LEKALRLPLELIAPDVVIEELHTPDGKDLVDLGLRVLELSGQQVLMVLDLAERYARPSRQDLFALVLARETKAVLLTGDGSLREAAEREGVQVHGTIWLLDLMVDHEIINRQERAASLKHMIESGSRLPCEEITARLIGDEAANNIDII